MPPLEAWGEQVYVSISETVECQDTVPNMIRVLASHDDTRVTFVPAVHDPIVLDAGEHASFELTEDVLVLGSDAILVAQYLLGQNYQSRERASSFERGDPSLSLAIPLEQWRESYAILSPRTFPENYVNIIAQEGQQGHHQARLRTAPSRWLSRPHGPD
jgi:hypothetical protein